MVGDCHQPHAVLPDALGLSAVRPVAVGEEEERAGSLSPRHRLLSYCRHFGLTHTASLAFLFYFDMICPPWAVAVQRDEGPRSRWSEALPAAGARQGVIYSKQRLWPLSSSSSRSFLLRLFLGH